MNVADIVRGFATERPDHVALRWEGGELTWVELDERSNQVARMLARRGVGPGDRVALLDKNGPEHFELLYAAAKLGAVFTPLNFRLSAAELADIVADAAPTVWVAGSELAETAVEAKQTAKTDTDLVIIGRRRGGDGETESYAELITKERKDPVDADRAPDATLLQLYTSGTTGSPKGVELTDANVLACVSIYDDLMGIGADDAVCLAPLPLFHVGGTTWALAAHRFGTTVILMRDAMPGAIVEILERDRVTHAGLVPALMQALLAVPDVAERDLSALSALLYGAAPITEGLLRDLMPVLGCDFFQAYGSTETTAAVAILAAGDHDPTGARSHLLASCGRPVPGVDFRVVDVATGADVGPGEVGELWVRGPNVMKGYFGRPSETATAVVDGWFRSGDVGTRDDEGYLYLRDRTRDVIISGGENLYPTEIELALSTHPAVAECAVIGVPDERWGETPKAFVVLGDQDASEQGVTEQELLEHCRARLAHYKCPTSVELVDALPRNAIGKVLRKDLRRPYWSEAGRLI